MVEEPTKTLRGALAFFRGASCSIKFRDPNLVGSDESISSSRDGKSMQQTKIREIWSNGRDLGE
jgi:hypothetical protein